MTIGIKLTLSLYIANMLSVIQSECNPDMAFLFLFELAYSFLQSYPPQK